MSRKFTYFGHEFYSGLDYYSYEFSCLLAVEGGRLAGTDIDITIPVQLSFGHGRLAQTDVDIFMHIQLSIGHGTWMASLN